MPEEFWANAVFSVVPTLLIALVFWFIMRAILRADRNERAAQARLEEQELARLRREQQ